MNVRVLAHAHAWNVTPAEARRIQAQLREKVIRWDRFPAVRKVVGVDVGFENGGAITRAAVVVLAFPGLELVEQVVARRPTQFPYVPGLLSFREIPAVLEALAQLKSRPDLMLCDGQGIAHPRRLGIASHLGVLTGLATVGVAKSILVGRHRPTPERRGEWTPLMDGDEIIGAVLRTREKVKPVYVSPGHKVGLESAIGYTMRCTTRYRLPEATRLADKLASRKS